ncbi:MAG: BspA family leucine-rich repeat surface protein, partial [Bacteriovoracaceae bacterium]|nr:BspA family leucine-rich repeat surface protein [Bacteriovoracaceae bacterium]
MSFDSNNGNLKSNVTKGVAVIALIYGLTLLFPDKEINVDEEAKQVSKKKQAKSLKPLQVPDEEINRKPASKPEESSATRYIRGRENEPIDLYPVDAPAESISYAGVADDDSSSVSPRTLVNSDDEYRPPSKVPASVPPSAGVGGGGPIGTSTTTGGGVVGTSTTTTGSVVTPPKITNVTATNADGTYNPGASLTIQITFDKAVDVTGTPSLTLETGTADAVITYVSGSGSTTLVFTYNILNGHESADLNYLSTSALGLSGGSIVASSGGDDAELTLPLTTASSSLGGNKNIVIVDNVQPFIQNITSSLTDGTYGTAQVALIQVTMNEVVNVTGVPTLTFDTGGAANYVSGTGTNILTFSYTVNAGESSLDLDVASVDFSTVRDIVAIPNTAVNTLPATNLATNKALVIDTSAPTITAVDAAVADGTYGVGAVIPIEVTFSENIFVVGVPTINLNNGVTVNYTTGTGTNTLTFNYIVSSADTITDLDVTSVNLPFVIITIKDVLNNDADLTLPVSNLAANSNINIDTSSPTITSINASAALDGSHGVGDVIDIVVNFSEAVSVGTSSITLDTGVNAVYQSGTNTTSITYRYTVLAGHTSADLDVTAFNIGGAADGLGNLVDATLPASNLAANRAIVIDTAGPTITQITSADLDGVGNVYSIGESLQIQVTFSENVTVGGTLDPTLTLSNGGVATYNSGSGTTVLVFDYTVLVANSSITIAPHLNVSSINLGTATIRDVASNNTSTVLPGANNLDNNKDIYVDTVVPTITNITSPIANGSYSTGQVITIDVTFSEAVSHTVGAPDPFLNLSSGGTAVYTSDTGTVWTFTYTVGAADAAADLGVTSVNLNTDTIRDAAGNNANLGMPVGANLNDNKNIAIDTGAPYITSINSLTADGTYIATQAVAIRVNFNEAVNVVGGPPTLTLNSGGTATYNSGASTATVLVFDYTVLAGHNSADLDVTAFNFAGATVRDSGLNDFAGGLPVNPNRLQDLKALVIDAQAPTITNITSAIANGTYSLGSVIDITVTFSENITISGTPTITLDTGDVLNMVSSTANTITFNYTVGAGDASADLDVVSMTAGTFIRDAATNNANLAIPASDLAFNKNIIISTVNAFISRWQTTAPAETITLPLRSGFNYNFFVDWGDGAPVQAITAWNDVDKTHAYAAAGTYTVTIYGTVEAWFFAGAGDKDKIIAVDNLGAVGWRDFYGAFMGCNNLTTVLGGDTSLVTNMGDMFRDAPNAQPDGSTWDTSNVTNFTYAFSNAWDANPNTAGWDTSNVTSFALMFHNATSANPNTSSWDTSSATTMALMFYNASSANPDVDSWDTSNVTTMEGMFYGASVANPVTNTVGNIWNTSNVTNMSYMFALTPLANPNTSGWNTSNVTNFSNMFMNAVSANPNTSGWNTSSATNMSAMFRGATSANPDVDNWNTLNVTNMSEMFYGATIASPVTTTVGNIWNTSNVTNMSYMFYGATNADPDLSGWSISNVTNMEGMFIGSLQPIISFSNFLIKVDTTNSNIQTFGYGPTQPCNVAGKMAESQLISETWTITNPCTLDAAPTIASINAAPALDGVHSAGAIIDILVNFSEAVTTSTSTLTLDNGTTAVYQSGSGTSAVTYRYTVGAADANTLDLNVSVYNLGNAIDAGGNPVNTTLPVGNNLANNRAIVIDALVPTISSINAAPALDTSHDAGSVIDIIVNFSEIVNAGTSTLTLDTGATAVYQSGTGTTSITYRYTVSAGHNSLDLNVTSFNVGTANDAGGNLVDGTLPVSNLANNRAIVIDTTAPTIASINAAPAEDGVHSVTRFPLIDITVNFSEAVTTTTSTLTLDTGATAVYQSGSGTSAIVYRYTVGASQNSSDLNVTAFNIGNAQDAAGNAVSATLPGSNLANNRAIVIDTTAPTISSISSTLANGTYGISQVVDITVVFSENIFISGTPTLTLDTGDTVNMVVSGANSITFNYTVGTGDSSADLNVVSMTAGIYIRDAGDNDANLAMPISNLANNKNIAVDGVDPTVIDVITPVALAREGDNLQFRLKFSEIVNVTGAPYISVQMWNQTVNFTYGGGTGTDELIFSRTIAYGDNDDNGLHINPATITLSGGTIRDTVLNNAVLNFTSAYKGITRTLVLTKSFDIAPGWGNVHFNRAPGWIQPTNWGDVCAMTNRVNKVGVNPAGNMLKLNTSGNPVAGFNSLGFNGLVRDIDIEGDGSGDYYVAGEFSRYGETYAPRIIKLNADGTPDAGFFANPNNVIYSIVKDNTINKLYVVGVFSTVNQVSSPGIVRLNLDGSIDTSFVVGTGFSGGATKVMLANDGTGDIYVTGGSATYKGISSPRIVRIQSDGSIRSTFNVGTGLASVADATLAANDGSGKIYVASYLANTYNGTGFNGIIRLNTNGTIDPAFSTASFDYYITEMINAPDVSGDIYVTGGFSNYNGVFSGSTRILRFNNDGSLDAGYNHLSSTILNGATGKVGVYADAGEAKVFSYGTTYIGSNTSGLFRNNLDGTVDAAFPGTTFDIGNFGIYAVARLDDGSNNLIAAGVVVSHGSGTTLPNEVACVNGATGAPSATFTGTGFLNTNQVTAAVSPSDNSKEHIYVWGSNNYNSGTTDKQIRILKTGANDATFNFDESGINNFGYAIVEDKINERFFYTGPGPNSIVGIGQGSCYIKAILPDGSEDPSFTKQEFGLSGYSIGGGGCLQGLAVTDDGKIYIGGSFTHLDGVTAGHNKITRLNSDGSIDTSFAGGTRFGTVNGDAVYSIEFVPDGSGDIYVGGIFSNYNGTAKNHIVRLNADGSLDSDTGFNAAGGSKFNSGVYDIQPALDGTNDIYVYGAFTAYNGTLVSQSFVRLKEDGTINTDFNYGWGFSSTTAPQRHKLVLAEDGSGDLFVTSDRMYGFNEIKNSGFVRLKSEQVRMNDIAATNGTYNTGNTVTIVLTFDGNITVTGGPILYQLNNGATASCTYTAPNKLTCSYVVGYNESTPDLDFMCFSCFNLNGATITDAGGKPVYLGVATGAYPGSLKNDYNVIINSTAQPYVTQVTSPLANGTYRTGDLVPVHVKFSENVSVTGGIPRITMETGTNDQVLDFTDMLHMRDYQYLSSYEAGGNQATSADLYDLNNDGHLDLILNAWGADSLKVRLNNGNGTFAAAANYGALGGINIPKVADVDRDGYLDIITQSGTIPSYLNILKNDKDGTFTNTQIISNGATGAPLGLDLGDFNADGYVDIVAIVDHSRTSIYLNDGTGTFVHQNTSVLAPPANSVQVGDFNNDNKLDFVYSSISSTTFYYYEGVGDGTFNAPSAAVTASSTMTKIYATDVDNNGSLDLVAVGGWLGGGTRSIEIFKGNNNGTFSSFQTMDLPDALASATFAHLVDDDNDSDIDFYIGSWTGSASGQKVYYYNNNGSGTYNFVENWNMSNPVGKVATGDIDNDGAREMFVPNHNSGTAHFSGLSDTLVFNYNVEFGDASADLNYLATNSLNANGATIQNSAATPALLTLPALASVNALAGNKNLVINGSSPIAEWKIYASAPQKVDDHFGSTKSYIHGNRMFVSAKDHDYLTKSNVGAVYYYEFENGKWEFKQKMMRPEAFVGSDSFGIDFRVEADELVVGSYGAVYYYTFNGVQWLYQSKITPSDGVAAINFGINLDLHEGKLLVGAYGSQVGADVSSGKVYYYTESAGTWTERQIILNPDSAIGDRFGKNLALYGNFAAIVGALDDQNGTDYGAVYVYELAANTWSMKHKFMPTSSASLFDSGVDISGERLVLSSQTQNSNEGEAYFYTYNGTNWVFVQAVTASDGFAGLKFGASVALHGDIAVIGAIEDDNSAGNQAGALYVFQDDGTGWNERTKIIS